MNIGEFQSQVSKAGLARANRWTIEITPPKGLSAIGASLINVRNGGFANYPVLGDIDLGDVINANVNISTALGDIQLGIGSALGRLELFCNTCQIPSRDMSNFEATMYGEKRSFATKHTHDGINCTFYCSEDMRERRFFENWQNLIFDPVTKKSNYYANYIGEVTVKKWDVAWKDITAIYRFKEAYPTNIGANELSQDGALVELGITWNFRNYERIL